MGYWQDREREADAEQRQSVGRPRGTAWRALQADGIVWEGQVLLVGLEVDLAARLIVTNRRVAFARGGEIILEVPRAWLWPAPVQRRDGTVVLSITSTDGSVFAEPETIAVQMREGQRAAGDLVALLAKSGARLLPPDDLDDRFPVRATLPPLPDDPLPPPPVANRDASPFSRVRSESSRPPRVDGPDEPAAVLMPPPDEPPLRRSSPPVASGQERDWNLRPIREMVPRSRRRRRGWALRLGGLFLLLATAALAGSSRLPPGGNDGGAPPLPATSQSETVVAQAPPPTVTVTATAAERTALAFGVGGADITGPETETPTPTVVPEPTPSPTPTPILTPSPVPPTAAPPPMLDETDALTPSDIDPSATPAPTATAPPPPPSATATSAPPATSTPVPPTEAPPPPAAEPMEPAETAASADAAPGANPLAYSVAVAKRGATLPEFGLPESDFGEWVALVVTVENRTPEPVDLPMNEFQLLALPSGDVSTLDAGTGVIAGVIGLDPAFGPGETVRVRPDRERQLALVFAVAPGAENLRLQTGQGEIDLDSALAASGSLEDVGLD